MKPVTAFIFSIYAVVILLGFVGANDLNNPEAEQGADPYLVEGIAYAERPAAVVDAENGRAAATADEVGAGARAFPVGDNAGK